MPTIPLPSSDSDQQARRVPAPCPICRAPGGFHDEGAHAVLRVRIIPAAPPTPKTAPVAQARKNPKQRRSRRTTRCELRLFNCTGVGTTIDHIVPLSRGGLDEAENRRSACENCNFRKGNRLDSELTEYDFPLGIPAAQHPIRAVVERGE